MSASKNAKLYGCQSLSHVSRETGKSLTTLRGWDREQPKFFKIVCRGVAEEWKEQREKAQWQNQ